MLTEVHIGFLYGGDTSQEGVVSDSNVVAYSKLVAREESIQPTQRFLKTFQLFWVKLLLTTEHNRELDEKKKGERVGNGSCFAISGGNDEK